MNHHYPMGFPMVLPRFPMSFPAEASDFKERQRLRGEESWAERMVEVFAAGEGQGKPLLVINGG